VRRIIDLQPVSVAVLNVQDMPRHFGLHPPDVGQKSNCQRFVNLLHFVLHDLRIPFPQVNRQTR
jgi:hypothetical protein